MSLVTFSASNCEPHRLRLQPQQPGLDDRRLEQIVDQILQNITLFVDDLQKLALRFRTERHVVHQQRRRIALDRGQRRPHLVRQRRHHLRLQPVGLAQRLHRIQLLAQLGRLYRQRDQVGHVLQKGQVCRRKAAGLAQIQQRQRPQPPLPGRQRHAHRAQRLPQPRSRLPEKLLVLWRQIGHRLSGCLRRGVQLGLAVLERLAGHCLAGGQPDLLQRRQVITLCPLHRQAVVQRVVEPYTACVGRLQLVDQTRQEPGQHHIQFVLGDQNLGNLECVGHRRRFLLALNGFLKYTTSPGISAIHKKASDRALSKSLFAFPWGCCMTSRLTCRPECGIVGRSGMTRVPAIGVDRHREVLVWSCLHRLAFNATQRTS